MMRATGRKAWAAGMALIGGGLLVAATADGRQERRAAPATEGEARAIELRERAEHPFDYFGGLRFDTGVPTPESVLGYAIGDRFTRHADLVAYITALGAASDRVRVERYGASHQGRSLNILTISSPANLSRLDEILERNRELADPRATDATRAAAIIESNPAVVWLSFNVHGNEASCTDAAIQVAYTLAAAMNPEVREILDKCVVVIDPLLNPDGRERYISWYDNTRPASGPLENPDAAEHDEPWPGGRTNHYLFDLNRDWLWLVHPESEARLRVYRRHMPQLHIDYHEQEYRSPYFFGAGEDPYNQNIPAETREWVEAYGAANAAVFDRERRVFSTRERFDYLYPGYGKVLPVYHGAVGMLCERGGHGRAGLAIEVSDQHTLTLRERARDHFLTAMSYLETTAARRGDQLARFRRFFEMSMTPTADAPSAFVISARNDPALLEKVWRLCDAHGVEIHALGGEATLTGLRDYRTGEPASAPEPTPAGSWIIHTAQPRGRLVMALFERETIVTDAETYDITGWSLPVAFGLMAHYTATPVAAPATRLTAWTARALGATGDGDVAIVVDADQHTFPRAVGIAARHELSFRFAGAPVEVDGRRFGMGSLIAHTVANSERDLDALAEDLNGAGVAFHRASTGMTTSGHVLGANDNRIATLPKVVLLRGEPINPYSFGEIWHLLDLESPVPYTPVNASSLRSIKLHDYNVLVIPDASERLADTLGEGGVDRVKAWVREGGVVVATGRSAAWAGRALLDLKPDEEKEKADKESRPKPNELSYEERRLRRVEDNIPGAMLRAAVDKTHPLAAGAGPWVGVLKETSRPLLVGEDGYVVARFEPEPRIGGVISERNQQRLAGTPFITHHRLGSGSVVCFSDDVAIRGFMHAPMRLLMNAIVYGPSM